MLLVTGVIKAVKEISWVACCINSEALGTDKEYTRH